MLESGGRGGVGAIDNALVAWLCPYLRGHKDEITTLLASLALCMSEPRESRLSLFFALKCPFRATLLALDTLLDLRLLLETRKHVRRDMISLGRHMDARSMVTWVPWILPTGPRKELLRQR